MIGDKRRRSTTLEDEKRNSRKDVHFSRSSSVENSPPEERDKEGLIHIKTGAMLHGRYKILGLAGQGTFGTVLDVHDTCTNERLAIKVVRSVPRYLDAAQLEIEILEKIKLKDIHGKSLCVRLLNTFKIKHESQNHVCIGFEKLGRSLYEFIKKNNYRGFSLRNVKLFGYQILWAVAFCHRMKLVHTDLKPENILLCSSKYTLLEHEGKVDYRVPQNHRIRLIDFGGATFEDEHHSRIINTRQYRGPEILLGVGWSLPSDLWSVGCILSELFTGDYLFGTHEDMEHLALMEKVLERCLPASLTDQALKSSRTRTNSPNHPNHPSSSSSISSCSPVAPVDQGPDSEYRLGRAYQQRCEYEHHHRDGEKSQIDKKERTRQRSRSLPSASSLLHTSDGCLRWPEQASSNSSVRHVKRAHTLRQEITDPDFFDLLTKLLRFDPSTRITADQALAHPFFNDVRAQMTEELGVYPPPMRTSCVPFNTSAAPVTQVMASPSTYQRPSRERRPSVRLQDATQRLLLSDHACVPSPTPSPRAVKAGSHNWSTLTSSSNLSGGAKLVNGTTKRRKLSNAGASSSAPRLVGSRSPRAAAPSTNTSTGPTTTSTSGARTSGLDTHDPSQPAASSRSSRFTFQR